MKQGLAFPAAIAAGIAFASVSLADEVFEEIVVTVQKREQSARDVPCLLYTSDAADERVRV